MSKFEVTILRDKSSAKQTLGELTLCKDGKSIFTCKTLELPWLDNANRISCIPAATYKAIIRETSDRGKHFHVKDVPKRTWILVHSGNYFSDILGCILVGAAHTDINKDGYLDVTASKPTLKKLVELAPDGFDLIIKWK